MDPVNEHARGATMIVLMGASGSGKTVIGRRASEATGWSLYDTDARILEHTGADRISDVFDAHGEKYFRQLEAECLDEIASMDHHAIIATGGGMPAIPGMMERLNDCGVTIYLKASLDQLWKRLNTDPRQLDDRPLLREDGRSALEQLLEARERIYTSAFLTLDTDHLSVDEVCALVVTQIRSMDT